MKIFYRLFWAILIALALDGATKILAEQTLELYQPVQIAGEFFRFTLGYNSGVAFGIFANGGPWTLITSSVIIAALLVWFINALRSNQFPLWASWPIGLLLGGAIGNFIDRLLDGKVIDFLDAGIGAMRWPTFNLADTFIVIGVMLLMVLSFSPKKAEEIIQPPDAPLPDGEVDNSFTC